MSKIYFQLILLFLGCTACTSARIDITSIPEQVSVYAVDTETKIQPVLLGQTPITLTSEKIPIKDAFILRFSKKGFDDKEVVVPSLDVLDGAVRLKPSLVEKKDEQPQTCQDSFTRVRSILNFIEQKDYSNALKVCDQASKDYPQIIYFLTLKGSILFLQKEYKTAVTVWQQVLTAEPDNLQAKRMVEQLKRLP